MKKLMLIAALLVGCEDEGKTKPDWAQEDYTFKSQDQLAPQCPAPGTQHAESYQQQGGSDNALMWWMTMHAINSITAPTYHETTHVVHHYEAPPPKSTYRPSTGSSYTSRPTTPAPRTVTLKPVTPSVRVSMPKPSSSFGFKPSASRPASTSFRPSTTPSTSRSFSSGRR